MALLDISVHLKSGTPEWPGDTPFECRWTGRIAEGSSVNLSAISGSPHVGTHADAPLHVRDGWPASHKLPVEAFVGPAWVVDVRHCVGVITTADLALPDGAEVHRLLLHTGRSIADGAFPDEWPILDDQTLDHLLDHRLVLLGTDAPSVDERESKTLQNHLRLFSSGAYILENLDLRGILQGPYDLFAAPLKIDGLDAAPVRALLRTRPG